MLNVNKWPGPSAGAFFEKFPEESVSEDDRIYKEEMDTFMP